MGVSAAIACNCYRDGKVASPPPFPPEYLVLDKSGLHLAEGHDSIKNLGILHNWQFASCPHQGNHVFDICSWSCYRWFSSALSEIGWECFPTLQVPFNEEVWNETPSERCHAAIEEIDYFLSLGEIGKKTVLVEEKTGEVAATRIEAYNGEFGFIGSPDQNLCYGLDELEFFCRHRETGETVFRAVRFRQFTHDGKSIADDFSNVVWQNLDDDQRIEPRMVIDIWLPLMPGESVDPFEHYRRRHPTELCVERRPLRSDEFDYLLIPLRKSYLTAIQTGNDVKWWG